MLSRLLLRRHCLGQLCAVVTGVIVTAAPLSWSTLCCLCPGSCALLGHGCACCCGALVLVNLVLFVPWQWCVAPSSWSAIIVPRGAVVLINFRCATRHPRRGKSCVVCALASVVLVVAAPFSWSALIVPTGALVLVLVNLLLVVPWPPWCLLQ